MHVEKLRKRNARFFTYQTSHHATSEPEVLPIAEEPGCAEVNDEWSDEVFQDLVGDLSDWSTDVLNALSCVFSAFHDNTLQTSVCVATDLSVDIPRATVSDYRANVPRVPVRVVADWTVDVPHVPVCAISDCRVDVPQGPVSTTSAPGFDVADCCVDVPQATVCAISDCREDVPQATVCAISDCREDVPQATVWAISDCREDVPQATVCAKSDCREDVPQATVWAISDCREDVPQATVWAISDCRGDVPHASVGPTEDTVSPQLNQLEDYEIIDINSCSYEVVRKLGEGGFGSVYAGIRLTDGLKVALKFADSVAIEWMDIGYPELVPQEIGLLILANNGPKVPQIIQLLDWAEEPEQYVMVLERPPHCENLIEFLDRHRGTITEDIASVIIKQATLAAQTCCQRGVLHRDIKLENLLINPDSLDVKLIDFGCGEILTDAGYMSFAGTKEYCPPEFEINGEYHGEPATVWSLGILMFALLCGKFPKSEDLDELDENTWTKDGLSQECCELLCSLLQRSPEKRLELDNICLHNWFQYFNYQPEVKEIININSCSYEIGGKLGEGGFGSVYAGIRLTDGLEVALKFADSVAIGWMDIEGYPELVPQEIGLLILANNGPKVPQIIQLLDWAEEPEQYVMVLERPPHCENLIEFLDCHRGTITEDIASVIIKQATLAAQTCCQRGVLHRDIKLENLLINPDSLDVKLIDFGSGEILTDAGYTSFAGTKEYCPPEFEINGEYHGEPATVWSLGILMFALLCGKFPESEDLDELDENTWTNDGLSQECCELLCSLLQTDPEQRIELKNVSAHNWFNTQGPGGPLQCQNSLSPHTSVQPALMRKCLSHLSPQNAAISLASVPIHQCTPCIDVRVLSKQTQPVHAQEDPLEQR
ncbi:hypothetical protein ABG768_022153 [Culter alburnus]|uniref:non-specific serine/threonine protein kinase n=1 Tax=Culter alburnus TaxID=194366 RepID=A0AAW2AN79_CULAL